MRMTPPCYNCARGANVHAVSHTQVHTHKYTNPHNRHTHTYRHIHKNKCTDTRRHTGIHTNTHIQAYTQEQMHRHTQTHRHSHTHTQHTHTHTHTEWDTAVHLPLWVSSNERIQIEACMESWVELLLSIGANIHGLSQVTVIFMVPYVHVPHPPLLKLHKY